MIQQNLTRVEVRNDAAAFLRRPGSTSLTHWTSSQRFWQVNRPGDSLYRANLEVRGARQSFRITTIYGQSSTFSRSARVFCVGREKTRSQGLEVRPALKNERR
jgi:hypothetical protein